MQCTIEMHKVSNLFLSKCTLLTKHLIGALVVYDITDVDSFHKMELWVKELRQQLGNQVPIIIVGNKSDLEANR